MCNQPNDYFLESLWSFKKAVARLWSPDPRLANLNSASANLRPSSVPPTLRTPSSASRAMDARLTVPGEVPDNLAAHRVTISYNEVKHHSEGTRDCSRSGPRSPKTPFAAANKSYIVTPSVYPPTLNAYTSNLPIDRGLASADNDFLVLKHQSANIDTTEADISTTVQLFDTKISPAFDKVDDAEMAVSGMPSSMFLMKSISMQILQVTKLEAYHMSLSNLCNSFSLSCLVCALLKSCFSMSLIALV